MSIASIGGEFCERVRLFVPQHGIWFAEVSMLGDPALSGQVTLAIGNLQLQGTVTRPGTRGEQSFMRLVGGAGAWGSMLQPKAYHNDAGVKRKLVAEDAAREAGETLETLTTQEKLGTHYVRRAGVASRVLESAIGRAWHVGYDGVTRVGPRASHTPADGSYLVVDAQPTEGWVSLSMDDLTSVRVGSVLREGLDAEMVVRDLEVRVDSDQVEVIAWCGESDDTQARLTAALARLAQRAMGDRIWGKWRYRVIEMDGDRVKLQAVSRAAGLPDTMPVSMGPGVAGAHAELAPAAEVLVEFIEGSPTAPIITHFAGKDGTGFVPVTLLFDASSEIKLGAAAAAFIALSTKTDTEIQRIWTHLKTTFPATTAPAPDGGAGLWNAQVTAATAAGAAAQSTASTKVKSE